MSQTSDHSSEIRDSKSQIDNPLRRFVRPRFAAETCELCSTQLPSLHEHLIDITSRQMTCSCQACAILFSGKANPRYRRIPRRIRYLENFQMTDAQWDSLLIPIGMAFFFNSTVSGKVVALFPSPAGATESLLDLHSWDEIRRSNPAIDDMEADTEALLVNRVRGSADYYLLPIDECYKLVGLIRANWHGLSGGAEMWSAIGSFFADLKQRAQPAQAKTATEEYVTTSAAAAAP